MIKKLLYSLFLILFFESLAFAGYFEFVDPGIEEKVLKEEVENGSSILVNINTVAVDNQGNLYCLKSDLDSILQENEAFTWEEMEEIKYTVKIVRINLEGEESVFAEGKLPLKTTIAGILFDWRTRRLLLFLKTLSISEDCPFFSSIISMGDGESGGPAAITEDQEKKVWDWSGLENCLYEKVSIIEITGFEWVTPF
jgi:hypothetical protein